MLYRGLGLTNSFWVYIVPGAVSALNMLVIRTYMNGLPDSLEESAKMDGAGHFTIFCKIVAPLCMPVFATIALFIAVGQWNSWFDAMLYNRMSEEYTTLQYELMKLLSQRDKSERQYELTGEPGKRRAGDAGVHSGSGNHYYGYPDCMSVSVPAEILCNRTYNRRREGVKDERFHYP